MSIAEHAFKLLAGQTETASAHCDIPCGIYDPHHAQIAALTIIRMNQLIEAMPIPAPDDNEHVAEYLNNVSRYVAVKEEHAKIAESELVILWSDYFKPEHLEKFPNLHDVFWKTCKLCSTVKQQLNMEAAQSLLDGINTITEMFWASKNVPTKKRPSLQPTGGEIVVPNP
jgi:nickel superoxide dismutase